VGSSPRRRIALPVTALALAVPLIAAPARGDDSAKSAFGLGVALGAASVAPSGSPARRGFDGRIDLGFSGAHLGVFAGVRGVYSPLTLLGVDLTGRYYPLDSASGPFASVGYMPVVRVFSGAQGRTDGGVGGTALTFELGEELLRDSTDLGLRFAARVDLPLFALKDDSGQSRAFWVGSLVVGVEAKHDALSKANIWLL
jgi:hypothetical protein